MIIYSKIKKELANILGLLCTIVFLLSSSDTSAQVEKKVKEALANSNFNTGYNLYEKYRYAESEVFLRLAADELPQNYFVFLMLGRTVSMNLKAQQSIKYYKRALELYGKKDNDYRATIYYDMATSYVICKDTVNAAECYKQALSIYSYSRKKMYLIWSELSELGYYDDADKALNKVIEENKYDIKALAGLAYDKGMKGNIDDAVKELDNLLEISGNNESVAFSKAKLYYKKGMYEEAWDVIQSNGIYKTSYHMIEKMFGKCNDEIRDLIVSTMLIEQYKDPTFKANAIISYLYADNAKDNDKALLYLKQAVTEDDTPNTWNKYIHCLEKAGYYELALRMLDLMPKEEDESDIVSVYTKSECYFSMGEYTLAIAALDEQIKPDTIDPKSEFGFEYLLSRAFKLRVSGQSKEALSELNRLTKYVPVNASDSMQMAFLYTNRAESRLLLNDIDSAKIDARKAIEIEESVGKVGFSMYDYIILGDTAGAIKTIEKYVKQSKEEGESEYYNPACAYSRLGMKEKAFEYLRRAFDNNYSGIGHCERDTDLDNIHGAEFDTLMDSIKIARKEKMESYCRQMGLKSSMFETKEKSIKCVSAGKYVVIDANFGTLGLKVSYDKNSEKSTISDVEASFLYKNNYITASDIVTEKGQKYIGGDMENAVVCLKNLDIAGIKGDVYLTVVKKQKEPIIINGRTMIRFGSVSVDRDKGLMTIKYDSEQ